MSEPANASTVEQVAERTLRLLSYNIQIGITTRRYRQYLTHSWKHVLHHPQRFNNLDRIAQLMSGYDLVGVQEADAGSARSGFVNITEYLANAAGFPYWDD
jgi:endonuclease/exonuclease/phosphatase family metal-dependent hydrolase